MFLSFQREQGASALPGALCLAGLALTGSLLAGCGSSLVPASSPGIALRGMALGGQQPVAGAVISLYAAGMTGNGTGALDLLAPTTVTTTSAGNFTVPATAYNCATPTTQVYLVARGGNPGLAAVTSNPALVLVAALGDCSNLGTSFIDLNEVSTAAAAWSLAQFFGPGAVAGASPTNATGLRNAFGTAATLNDLVHGSSPGASLPLGTTVESAKVYSLANSLAQCVNSDGGLGCQPLFGASTLGGVAPTNTFDAALNIVRNPGANVSAVYQAAGPAPPFASGLAAAPADWTVSITYGNCTSGCGGLDLPGTLAIDSGGNIWVANFAGAEVSKFAPNGTPFAPAGYPGVGLNQSFAVAIDPFDNAWIVNEQSNAAAQNSRAGSVSKFNSMGTELSAAGYTGGGVYFPQAIATTSTGLVWVADYGSSSATLLANNGTAISGSGGFAQSAIPFTGAVAVDAAQNGWFAGQHVAVRVTPAGVTSSFTCCSQTTAGIAIDPSGNVWISDYSANAVVELSSAGTISARVSTLAGQLKPQGIAVDGSGNVWAANYLGNSITAITGATAAMRSPTAGFCIDARLSEPSGIAIDAGGNLWISNAGSYTLTEIVGVAGPVKTPLTGPPAQP